MFEQKSTEGKIIIEQKQMLKYMLNGLNFQIVSTTEYHFNSVHSDTGICVLIIRAHDV